MAREIEMETKPTVEVMMEMAGRMRDYADNMERVAQKMEEREDLTYASEAIGVIQNLFLNLRIDLLVTRPMREYERKQNKVI
jgi:hypothetical protein